MQTFRGCFDEGFIPKAGIDECLQGGGTTFDQQRLQVPLVKRVQLLGQLWLVLIGLDIFHSRLFGMWCFSEDQCACASVKQVQV